MDDNDNIMDFQKMNFSPFAATQFAGLSANAVNQFAASKFAQNITGANGQIVGVVSGGDGGVSYLRPIDNNNSGPFSPTSNHLTSNQQNQSNQHNQQQNQQHHQSMNESSLQQHHHQQQHQALITLPITMPGAKPGDAAQTVHIQVINPNPIPQPTTQTKFPQIGQMQIPIQGFQSGNTTVLTVAYSPQDGKFISNHGFPEGMTVVAALQPQDLQILAQAQAQAQAQVNAQLLSNQQHQQQQNENHHQHQQQQQNQETVLNMNGNLSRNLNHDEIIVKQEPTDWESTTALTNSTQSDLSEFITTHSQGTSLPMTLTPFLKFNPNSIKYETPDFTSEKFDAEQLINRSETSPTSNPNNDSSMLSSTEQNSSIDEGGNTVNTIPNGDTAKQKRKRRVKKPKVVKPKPPKPGQVLIATTIDGTVLFCCPECQMAYPEKENLEQHLTEHKIERRYICDICGAGLKRKEHLERHKSGHNPERPYICSVCMKGFKRKEHLNLHFVIHSGEKNEICGECGKGFYRKDHLRKHTNSHIAKRLKEEMNAREGISPTTPKTKKIKNITAISISDGSGIGGGVGYGGGNGINNNNNNNDKNSINNNNNNNNNEIQSSLARNDNNNMIMHTAIQIGDSVNPHNIQLDPLQLTSTLNNNKNSNSNNNNNNNNNRDNNTLIGDNNNAINISINSNCGNTQTTQPAISLSTVYVPTSNNTTLPVQIQIPQIITTSKPDGTTESTIVMPSTTESQNSTAMSTS